jgi:hypothetical protein
MARWVAPDRGVKETVIGGQSYFTDRQGIYNVENKAHQKAMKAEGFFEASLNPISAQDRTRGFTCVECGFEGWFRKCGRCGYESQETQRDGE